MAKIEFLPVCSACGRVLYGTTVDYVHESEIVGVGISLISPKWSLRPKTCPYCGEKFEELSMPRTLPFKGVKCEVPFPDKEKVQK